MTAVIERTARIVAIPRFLSPMHPTRNPWRVADMDWFCFHRSIPALVRGIDHPPMSEGISIDRTQSRKSLVRDVMAVSS